MMKKLVTILAVLLTAAVVNGAEETKSKSWDFTGSMVDFKATFPDPIIPTFCIMYSLIRRKTNSCHPIYYLP